MRYRNPQQPYDTKYMKTHANDFSLQTEAELQPQWRIRSAWRFHLSFCTIPLGHSRAGLNGRLRFQLTESALSVIPPAGVQKKRAQRKKEGKAYFHNVSRLRNVFSVILLLFFLLTSRCPMRDREFGCIQKRGVEGTPLIVKRNWAPFGSASDLT